MKVVNKSLYRAFWIYEYENGSFGVAPQRMPFLRIKKGLFSYLDAQKLVDVCYSRAEEKQRKKAK